MMEQGLVDLKTASDLINSGRCLSVAGDESLLKQLPSGRWIGGSTPYFIGEQGGVATQQQVYVNDFSRLCHHCDIKSYGLSDLHRVMLDAPDNGFSLIILPGDSDILSAYARHAPGYEDVYLKPVTGWVSGTYLSAADLNDNNSVQGETSVPVVINGENNSLGDDQAVVMHITLPQNKIAHLNMVNLFQQGSGPRIQFPRSGFNVDACLIDGRPQNFSDYLVENHIDTRLPLVADYCGAMINVSLKENNQTEKTVSFYAPVFNDIEYRLAQPVENYIQEFEAAMPEAVNQWTFACNCILNYLFLNLEGKKTANITGPITFGEIAYQLINQTMVYLTVEDC